jgi:hypothetical protein
MATPKMRTQSEIVRFNASTQRRATLSHHPVTEGAPLLLDDAVMSEKTMASTQECVVG